MKINFARAVAAGMVATLVMTAVGLWIAPLMGMPAMNPADMLAGSMGGSILLGWAAHVMIGTVLALGYAIVAPLIPGPLALRGALYAIAPFLAAQILVMPMMGMPVFSGSAVLAMGSLVGHLVYGAVLGQVYGPVPAREPGEVEPHDRNPLLRHGAADVHRGLEVLGAGEAVCEQGARAHLAVGREAEARAEQRTARTRKGDPLILHISRGRLTT
jgi:uncharacterized membrane protein YagU involved in acid resistance